jgi:hypothetical protein
MIKQFAIALLLIAALSMSFSMVQSWNIAEPNAVTFRIKSLMGMVSGSLGGLQGAVNFDPADASKSSMDVTLDLSTIKTGNDTRDGHLKEKEEWFDAVKFPKIEFKSSTFAKTPAGYDVSGDMIIKGTTRKVKIPFTFSETGSYGTFEGNITLNRLDFGVGKSGMAVKDCVEIAIKVPVKK